MFPKVAPKFFESRAQGRKNLGKDSDKDAANQEPTAKAKPSAGAPALRAQVDYVITLNGKEHRVTVTPEK